MKNVKLLALFSALALTLIFTGCNTGGFKSTAYKVLPGGTNGTTGTSWTYVLFGDWPQTIKADSVTVDENKSVSMGSFTYYKGSDGAWYAKLSNKYYKVEPIKWRVLTDDYNGKKLLLAENILSAHRYAASSNNYKNSEIREWLNGTFLSTAFTADSVQNQIARTVVDNSARSTKPDANPEKFNRGENKYACENTGDKIFLLSEQEVTTEVYGFTVYNLPKVGDSRIRMTTDFAKASGAWQSTAAGCGGCWWLRSPRYDTRYDSNMVCTVGEYGYAGIGGEASICVMGVVPALCLEN